MSRNNITIRVLFAALVAGGSLLANVAAWAGDYVVIVNAGNDASGDIGSLKQLVKRQFLKQQTSWPNKEPSLPFARGADSAAHKAFLQNVLAMSQAEIDTHFLRLKQTTGETPPRQIGSTRILIRQVTNKAGAFGIIEKSDAASLSAEVRILFEF